MKRACILKHVPFEGPGVFGEVLREQGYDLRTTLVPEEGLPADDFDFLLVMGGPMSVNDPDPWITEETAFIRRAIVEQQQTVLGICLGSQFMARALGGSVAPGQVPEIGLTTLRLTEAGRADPCFEDFPSSFSAVEWHGEGITLPPEAVVLASSPAYPVQAFRYGQRAYGLLFHLEADERAVAALCRECPGDVTAAGLTPEDIMAGIRDRLPVLQRAGAALLRRLLA